ncbi:MAG: Cell division protein FtsA [Flavobacterium sp. SCGC AAA160-P02]|nr:MAG: Cell division protein FtsA [Flavobacterium sp. SCGC AAA160-P02]
MDARIGYPNEHLAGDSDDGLSSPSYSTAVGLLMEGLENHHREQKEEVNTEVENQEDTEIEKTPPSKKKSFFEKFTDGLKEFLDNAE